MITVGGTSQFFFTTVSTINQLGNVHITIMACSLLYLYSAADSLWFFCCPETVLQSVMIFSHLGV